MRCKCTEVLNTTPKGPHIKQQNKSNYISRIVNNADKCNLLVHKQTNNKVCYARNDAQAYLYTIYTYILYIM